MNPLHATASEKPHGWLWGTVTMVIVAVAFAVLNVLTPMYHDDFVYQFMFEGGTVNYDHPVKSIGDVLASQVEHYHSVNGRSIVHCLAQVWTGLLGKPAFNVANVLVFGIFLLLLIKLTGQGGRPGTPRHLLPSALVLILLMPRFKDTFLWMTGSINYLWSATAAMVFLLFYERHHGRPIDGQLLPMMLLAFLLGWTHEGITLPLAASLILINIFPLAKHRFREQSLWLAVAYLAGGCVIALAPGTIARSGAAGGFSPSSLGLKVITGLTVLGRLKVVYLALLASAVAWMTSRDTLKRVVTDNGYLLLAMLLSLGIVFASGIESARTAFGLEFFAMIYMLRLLAAWLPQRGDTLWRWCNVALTVGLVVFYGLLLRHTVASWQESQRLIAQIERTGDGIIGTNEHDAGPFSSHVCTMLSLDSTVNAMNYNPHGWPASIAATYHRDSLVFLPQAFLDDLQAVPERYDALDLKTDWEFYVERIGDEAAIDSVVFELAPNDFSDVPLLFRPIARHMNRYTATSVTTSKWVTLRLYGRRYLFVKKDHPLTRRLQSIHFTQH